MKEFDYELAKKGRTVKTRDGRPARIISFDCKDVVRPIVALVETEPNREEVLMYSPSGKTDITEPGLDLFIATTIVERWVNVYKCGCGYCYIYHDSEQEALEKKDYYSEYVATTKISWEE